MKNHGYYKINCIRMVIIFLFSISIGLGVNLERRCVRCLCFQYVPWSDSQIIDTSDANCVVVGVVLVVVAE